MPGTPVALLGRAGPARERLREALALAGAQIVLEDDPAAVDAQTLSDAGPTAVLVALEPAIEDALEALEPALALPGVTVIFDEADLAVRREGWEAQRWARHLAAKLHGHGNVLPPGA
ncbi:chemotaxis protein, partial [Xanthomonas sp. Kuri4-1]